MFPQLITVCTIWHRFAYNFQQLWGLLKNSSWSSSTPTTSFFFICIELKQILQRLHPHTNKQVFTTNHKIDFFSESSRLCKFGCVLLEKEPWIHFWKWNKGSFSQILLLLSAQQIILLLWMLLHVYDRAKINYIKSKDFF